MPINYKPYAREEILISIHSDPGLGKGILLDALRDWLASKGINSTYSNERERALGEYCLRIDTTTNNISNVGRAHKE